MEEKDNMNEEENIFNHYATLFCASNNEGEPYYPVVGVSRGRTEYDYNKPFFKDIETALASRVNGYDVARKIECDNRFYDRYEVSLTEKGLEVFNTSMSFLSKDVFDKNFSLEVNIDEQMKYGTLEFSTLTDSRVDAYKGQLEGGMSYHDICAILALAPRENIIMAKDILASEIARNKEKEADRIYGDGENDYKLVYDINAKYDMLGGCLYTLLDRFQKEEQKLDEDESDNLALYTEARLDGRQNSNDMIDAIKKIDFDESEQVVEGLEQ